MRPYKSPNEIPVAPKTFHVNKFIELQELPEQVRGGVHFGRISCIAEHDLTGKVNPGDRVKANGVLFIRSQRKFGKDTPVFDIFLRVQSLERQNLALEEIVVSDEEEVEIKTFASDGDVYKRISESIAFHFGMDKIKRHSCFNCLEGCTT